MAKKSILFVDDEPNVLSGLQRMFRVLRHEHDFHFLESGQAALDFMAEHVVDVIVSDMRMPGMDGAKLLQRVQIEYPHVIRIMLTGQADEESILRTVGVVHQFIAKPSDSETLKGVLGRACALQDLMQDEQLKKLVAGIGNLPSLPTVYAQLQQKLRDPECSLADIAKIVEQDLAMSAKVLQLVNSAFFGLYKNIDSVARAVNLLGLDTVKALVLSVGVFTELQPTAESKSFSLKTLWNHSMGVAAYAKIITQVETDSKEMIDEVFIAGFMHDIGKLLLFSNSQERYIETIGLARKEKWTADQAERVVLHATHGDVGGYLLGLWGLPSSVVETAAFHHRLGHYPAPFFCPAIAVHAADVIYHQFNPDEHISIPELNMPYLEQIGLSNRFDHWQELCREIEL
ncbi:MAG: HDOD domain-containing protein [Desulfobulbus sp.]